VVEDSGDPVDELPADQRGDHGEEHRHLNPDGPHELARDSLVEHLDT
jgi:hypothetical protein